MRCEDCREQLDAYVDGELAPDEARDVRDHVASCADCAAELRMMQDVSRRVKGSLEPLQAPDVLKARIRSALAQPSAFEPQWRPRGPLWPVLAAAGVLIAVLAAGGGFLVARRGVSAPAVSEQVLASHIRSLMPGHLTDVASTDQHNVKPWFNGRLDLSPSVPRLDSAGFPLVGGRLDYVAGRPVAAVVYTRRLHVINVFSWSSDDHAAHAPTVSTERGYHLIHWSNGDAEFWAASDLAVPELEQFVALFAAAR